MKRETVICVMLLMFTLLIGGCSGMNTYQSTTGGGAARVDCGGDVPSDFPPYCHPSH